jgi:hypothetical protein
MRTLKIKVDCNDDICGNCSACSSNGLCHLFTRNGITCRLKRKRATGEFRRCRECIDSEARNE